MDGSENNLKDILVIEDNEELSELVSGVLQSQGFDVQVYARGEDGLAYLEGHSVKLVILDIMLDGIDGFEVCSIVRQVKKVPILMMSAKNDDESKVLSLDLGADDYIEKPFTVSFFIAKVKALLRRNYEWKEEEQELLVEGNLTIETKSRRVYKDGKEINLAAKEYDLLLLMISHANEVLRKEWLFDQVWGYDSMSEQSSLTVHIRWLREKLEEDPKNPKLITTVWRVGYQWNRRQEQL